MPPFPKRIELWVWLCTSRLWTSAFKPCSPGQTSRMHSSTRYCVHIQERTVQSQGPARIFLAPSIEVMQMTRPGATGSMDEQPRPPDGRVSYQVSHRAQSRVHTKTGVLPLPRSLTLWGLGLVFSAIWLTLLVATNFSAVVVGLGLLVSLAILNWK